MRTAAAMPRQWRPPARNSGRNPTIIGPVSLSLGVSLRCAVWRVSLGCLAGCILALPLTREVSNISYRPRPFTSPANRHSAA